MLIQILTVVVHQLLTIELIMRISHLSDEIPHILRSLASPVADITSRVAGPVSDITSRTRNSIADVACSSLNTRNQCAICRSLVFSCFLSQILRIILRS